MEKDADRSELDAQDHRALGRRLKLFALDPAVGKGLPLWLPNGTVVRDELEKLAKELEFKAGFVRVVTPHLARTDLYKQSGHLPYYERDMYPLLEVPEDDGHSSAPKDSYALKPMNCPHHHRVFAAEPRSYRDLPLRLAEYGQVYRWERSGALSGLARVRGMCMNDGHIYCTEEQVASELGAVLDMYDEVYRLLGVKDAHLRLSLRDRSDARGKYVDDERAWEWAEAALRGALAARGVDYELGVGHAAFYGPKIDVQVRTVSSGEETLSTVQLDFVQPKRLGLHYTAPSGQRTVPYCIHRAPLSTHERFVAFIVEKCGGSLPTWLSPLQVVVMPVSEAQRGYADEVVRRLRARFVRAEAAAPGATLARNVRDASERKVPNIVIVGRREAAEGKVALRRGAGEAQLTLPLEEFERRLLRTIAQRSSVFAALEPA